MRHDPIDSALFVEHRQQLAAKLQPDSVAIVHAADPLTTNGDGAVRYVPAADLFWLKEQKRHSTGTVPFDDRRAVAAHGLSVVQQRNAVR